jgi:hypothetical protein
MRAAWHLTNTYVTGSLMGAIQTNLIAMKDACYHLRLGHITVMDRLS